MERFQRAYSVKQKYHEQLLAIFGVNKVGVELIKRSAKTFRWELRIYVQNATTKSEVINFLIEQNGHSKSLDHIPVGIIIRPKK